MVNVDCVDGWMDGDNGEAWGGGYCGPGHRGSYRSKEGGGGGGIMHRKTLTMLLCD